MNRIRHYSPCDNVLGTPKASRNSSSSRESRGPSGGGAPDEDGLASELLSSLNNGCGSSVTAACSVRRPSSSFAQRSRRRSIFLCSSSASANARLAHLSRQLRCSAGERHTGCPCPSSANLSKKRLSKRHGACLMGALPRAFRTYGGAAPLNACLAGHLGSRFSERFPSDLSRTLQTFRSHRNFNLGRQSVAISVQPVGRHSPAAFGTRDRDAARSAPRFGFAIGRLVCFLCRGHDGSSVLRTTTELSVVDVVGNKWL